MGLTGEWVTGGVVGWDVGECVAGWRGFGKGGMAGEGA